MSRSLVITFALTLLGFRPLTAQTDYRNLDDHRPVRTEDAYPVERFAFELIVPYEFEDEVHGERLHLVTPELSYGLFPNAQVGLKLPLAALHTGTNTDRGLAGPRLFALYNFNSEGPGFPAVALRTDLSLPAGSLAGDDPQLTLKAIGTRSWGLTRAHANASLTFGPEAGRPEAGAEPRWSASLAVDRTVLRDGLLLLGELGVQEAASAAPTEVKLAVGGRYQLTPTVVLDAGLSRRLTGRVGPDIGLTVGLSHTFALRGALPTVPPSGIPAFPRGRSEQFYYPGEFNWRFLALYPEAARLFNAFDYGHAVLYERLLTEPDRADAALAAEYDYLTRDLLVRPPHFGIAEEAVMPVYAKLAWPAKQMFDWAHVLHRQIYDAYADDRLTMEQRDSLVERLTDYYLSRGYAFTDVPKSMVLMDEQSFSQVFRRTQPAFNGLIWAYHWLQVGLYEPLIAARTRAEAKAGIGAAVGRFWQMVGTERYPTVMPMTSAVAPEFSRRHPRAAVIFDNLHMLHDIISDVLASPTIPRDRKREVIYAQLAEFRSSERNAMTPEEWHGMAEHMGGLSAMGGPATGLLHGEEPAPAPHRMQHQH